MNRAAPMQITANGLIVSCLMWCFLAPRSTHGEQVKAIPDSARSEKRAGIQTVLYVDNSHVRIDKALRVALEVHNNTEKTVRLPSWAMLERKQEIPKGMREAKQMTKLAASDPMQLLIRIKSTVPKVEGKSAGHMDMAPLRKYAPARVRQQVPKVEELAPGEAAFITLDLPHTLFVPGNCKLKVMTLLGEKQVSETEEVSVDCREE